MKLRFLALTFALVAPLAACSSNTPVASNTIQSPTAQASSSPTQNWYNYTAQDGSYTASFPRKPQEENKLGETTLGKDKSFRAMYEDKAQDRAYMTNSTQYAVDPSKYNAEKGLDGARDSQTKAGNTITSEKKISIKGFPGRELIMQTKEGAAIQMRMFIDPNKPTLYMALVVAGNGSLNFPEAKTFLDSFAVPK